MNTGEVAMINSERGFGFLKVEGREKNLFFHAKDMIEKGRFEDIRVGDKLSFESIFTDEKGSKAEKVDFV